MGYKVVVLDVCTLTPCDTTSIQFITHI